ncbi:CDP-alcohol phosphatidyltransferase [Streptomyces sp. NPDC057877]|uniref:CDP-alcohol phosphatidyltransferase n=1 Tax=Streptomyces sp. NPDC057877 TaxID=3346269 RepID=UPI00367E7F3C
MPVFTRSRHSQEPGSGEDAPDTTTEADKEDVPERQPLPARLTTRVLDWRTAHPQAVRALRHTLTATCAALILGALLLPNAPDAVRPSQFLRIPAEAIVGVAVLLALPGRRSRTALAVLTGIGLGSLTVLNLLDIGFKEYLGRGFNVVLDWELLDDAQSYQKDTTGSAATTAATIAIGIAVLVLFAALILAAMRLGDLLARNRTAATKGTLIAGTVWITCSTLGLQVAGVPLAADRAADTLTTQSRRVKATLRDEAAFAKEAGQDVYGATPPAQLVPDLRGKDVLFTFIESYGRSALEDPLIEPGVGEALETGKDALAGAGFHARSGWLTSATYGGSSWLGHSTFLSGLWIDNQQRYRTVTASDHLTLTKIFQKTGDWRTVGIVPGVQKGWPEAEFFGLDHVYDAFHLGYQGPKFSWSTMPDQYTLEAFQRLEHGKERDEPLMAEIILTSSHQPWAPLPTMVDWDDLGDGRLFEGIEKAGADPREVVPDSDRSKQEYGKSIAYSVTSLTQWLERYGSEDTVLVFLGDHQPLPRVSGDNASRDVPVSIVAKDPEVLDKIADWNWADGLRPAADTPVWRMDTFRDRFLTAYGSTPGPSGK